MAGAGYKLFVAGNVLTAAQMNTFVNEQTVMVFATSAARDAALVTVKAEGNLTYQADANSLTNYSGAAWSTIGPVNGALTAWTPVITQLGNVTVTNTHSTYMRIGRLVYAQFLVIVTGSGTAANVVTISTPVATVGAGVTDVVGYGYINDTSATSWYMGGIQVSGASLVKIQSNNITSFTYLGTTTFTAGLAVNDQLSGYMMFEAAADA